MNTMTTFAESKKSNFLGANINAYSPENDQAVFQSDAYQSPSHFGYQFGQLNIRNSAPVAIQPKLTIGAPNDKYEQEADRMADQVMRLSVPAQNSATSSAIPKVQRKCKGCEDELEGKLQTKSVSSVGAMSVTSDVAQNIQGLQGKGQPLPESERAFFEPRFGQDLNHVRIHTGSHATQTAGSIGARAFTLGNNVAFGQGEYQPGTTAGRRLMAHELTHVGQQKKAGYSLQSTVQRMGVFVSGGSSSVSTDKVLSSNSSGMAKASKALSGSIPGRTISINHIYTGGAINEIVKTRQQKPSEPIILAGHSFGGDSVIEMAEELSERGILIDLLVQVESVGIGDEKLPDNVIKGVNIFDAEQNGLINGAINVSGSQNIPLYNTSHTDIDDDPRTWAIIKRAVYSVR